MKLRSLVCLTFLSFSLIAASLAQPGPDEFNRQPQSFDAVIDRMIQTEASFNRVVQQFSPIVETYVQNLRPDKDLGTAPRSDQYFLGRLQIKNVTSDTSMLQQPGLIHRMLTALPRQFSLQFEPLGFAEMVYIDPRGLDRQHYTFELVRREFLGDLRCYVINVQPKPKSGKGRFLGRVWVEDQGYHIVRSIGIFTPKIKRSNYFLHFDSWRLNLQPNMWLPAYVYTEESDQRYGIFQTMHLKAQTRFWGYDLKNPSRLEESTAMTIESIDPVRDKAGTGVDMSPVQAQRAWVRLAEDNVLGKLQKAGLIAPEGEVDKVLNTVVNNLEITNNIALQPEVRTRVLLTTPLESFTVGNTIILSRGLLDVLPDEATLAAVLAHELAHITLGHAFDPKYAFGDRVLFADEETLQRFEFHRDPRQEQEADERAVSYLQNSPYKDKISSVGLFFESLNSRQSDLSHLIRAHMGNPVATGKTTRMAGTMQSAPKLEPRRLDQVASLPLGGRVRVDPWSCRAELYKRDAVPLISPNEKMPFEVTPVYPYLTRLRPLGPETVKVGELGQKQPQREMPEQ